MSKVVPQTFQSIPWEVLLQTCRQEVSSEMKQYLINLCNNLQSSNNCFDTEWINNNLLRLEICLDRIWEKLNTGHWKDVAIETRHSYTLCSVLKCILIEMSAIAIDKDVKEAKVEEIFEQIDKGLLLGAPLNNSANLLTTIASNWSERLKKKHSQQVSQDSNINFQFEEKNLSKDLLPGLNWIQRYKSPSMQTFFQKMFMPKTPGILEGCIDHWKALTAWKDPNYLIKVAGMRTVPIELGSKYTEEDWSQHLLTFSKFIQTYVIKKSDDVGYLAQHQLFEQIPELKDDFAVPDYCLFSDCSSESPPDVNAWFGPKGTVSPLHFDPKNNLLCQVFGYKLIILYNPNDEQYLYPFETKLLNNTAQVDPVNPDFDKYPDFHKAKGTMCYLGPGEMLFLPPKWWHYVASLTPSFSVSFWWE